MAYLIDVVALHRAGRLEAGEGEGIDIFVERHAVLQAERHRDGEVVEERAERRALLVHVDEDFAEPAVVVFAGAQIDFMPADHGLLRIALAPVGHPFALAHHDDALDDFLHDLFRKRGSARRGGLVEERLDNVIVLLVVGDELALQRLRQLRAVAVERVGFEPKPPGELVGLLAVLDRRLVRHVDGLGDGAGNKRLRRRQHADVAVHGQITLAGAAARIGAVEHGIVLGL